MNRAVVLVAAMLVATACTRVVDAHPVAALSVAPITEGQIRDLLSEDAQKEPVVGVGLYAKVEPAECASLVQEANSPLIFDAKPPINDGGFWSDGDAGVIEFAAVYRSDYNAGDRVAAVRRTIDSCQGQTLVSTGDDGTEPPDHFQLSPPKDSGSPDIAVWAVADHASMWACDNAFVAAYNAAVFITACGEVGGYDVLTLAKGALDRINKLANTVA